MNKPTSKQKDTLQRVVSSENGDVLGHDECVELGPWRKGWWALQAECHEGTALEDDGGMKE